MPVRRQTDLPESDCAGKGCASLVAVLIDGNMSHASKALAAATLKQFLLPTIPVEVRVSVIVIRCALSRYLPKGWGVCAETLATVAPTTRFCEAGICATGI